MEDIPLHLIIIPVSRHRLQIAPGKTGRELLSHCNGVNALLRDWRWTDDEISFVTAEGDNMLCCLCFCASDNEYNRTPTDWRISCKDYVWLVNPRLIPVMALIPPQPSCISNTYRVSSFHDVRRPGVRSVSVEQGVLRDPVIWVKGPLGGDGHQSIFPTQVYLQPWLSVPGRWGPTTAAWGEERGLLDFFGWHIQFDSDEIMTIVTVTSTEPVIYGSLFKSDLWWGMLMSRYCLVWDWTSIHLFADYPKWLM